MNDKEEDCIQERNYQLRILLIVDTNNTELLIIEVNATIDFGDLTYMFEEGKIALGILKCVIGN